MPLGRQCTHLPRCLPESGPSGLWLHGVASHGGDTTPAHPTGLWLHCIARCDRDSDSDIYAKSVGYSATGTIMSGTRPDDRRPGTEIFSNGNREGSNNFLYDGIDDNERLTLSIVLRPAVEAVREFKIQTNLYSADVGRNSGAVVDVITKSGTNDLHGSLFEFLRNSAMDARNFFVAAARAFLTFRLAARTCFCVAIVTSRRRGHTGCTRFAAFTNGHRSPRRDRRSAPRDRP